MSQEYQKSSHSIHDINLHIIMDHQILKESSRQEIFPFVFLELIPRICQENKGEILSGVVSEDHVHILISANPLGRV